jgi:hypothetical protein
MALGIVQRDVSLHPLHHHAHSRTEQEQSALQGGQSVRPHGEDI